jgi:Ca2+-binding EF-hand superfamily protein
MSIGAVGSSGHAGQLLKMLTRLADSAAPAAPTAPAPAPKTENGRGLAIGPKTLSDRILASMIRLQAEATAEEGGTPQDAAARTFAAMDSDGSGIIVQGEMEAYVESVGGTEKAGKQIYDLLSNNAAGGISQEAFAAAAATAQGTKGPRAQSFFDALGPGIDVFKTLDVNHDGVASADELNLAFNAGSTESPFAEGASVSRDEFMSHLGTLAHGRSQNELVSALVAAAERAYEASENLH